MICLQSSISIFVRASSIRNGECARCISSIPSATNSDSQSALLLECPPDRGDEHDDHDNDDDPDPDAGLEDIRDRRASRNDNGKNCKKRESTSAECVDLPNHRCEVSCVRHEM